MISKKQILNIHKILGLATGVVVFIVSITGCCWAFKEEIESLYDDYKTVTVEDKSMITVTEAKEIAQNIFPVNLVHGTLYQHSKDEAVEVIFYEEAPEFYQSVFLNPYSGEVIKVKDHLSGFFAFVLRGHTRLWLPKAIGGQIVGISILLFIFIIISGFILWIPKKRKNLKQRIKFDWKKTTRWKRKNFDLHTVIGFYVCSLALILAITGSIMSYNWFYYITYKAIGGHRTSFFEVPENIDTTIAQENTFIIDGLIPKLKRENPEAKSFELHYSEDKNSSIYVEVQNTVGVHYDADFRFFDKNTLQEIETDALYAKYENATVSDKALLMHYDIHIGSIAGLPGKIIVFLISLLTASLPVTGTLLWYGRKYKKKKIS